MPEIVDKSIGDLLVAATMDDDSLIPGQQQGGSVSFTGRLLKAYAEDAGRKAAEHIKQGPPGEDFKILGYFATLSALQAAVPAPDAGDAYGVGAAAPYDIYVYDGIGLDWVNNGSIQGPAGPQGPQGEKGETGETGPRGETGSTGPQGEQGEKGDTGPVGPEGPQGERGEKGDTGPQGPQGVQGATGPVGPVGPEGPQGPKGETGSGFKVLDYYTSLSALQAAVPTPSIGDAYGIGTAEPYNIYIYGATSGWVNNGPLQGAKGDTGEQGPVGPIGPEGPRGPEGPEGPQGEKGETGATGPQGPEGPQGERGIQGEPGPEGPQGPAGADGATGPEGPQGPAGAPATINGVNTLNITTDEYLSADQDGDTLKLGLKSVPTKETWVFTLKDGSTVEKVVYTG